MSYIRQNFVDGEILYANNLNYIEEYIEEDVVPSNRKINGYSLSGDIDLTAQDVEALANVNGSVHAVNLNNDVNSNRNIEENNIDDTDVFQFYDTSVTSERKTKWSNIKSKIKAYLDNSYVLLSSRGVANGIATLDSNSKVMPSQSRSAILTFNSDKTLGVSDEGKLLLFNGSSNATLTIPSLTSIVEAEVEICKYSDSDLTITAGTGVYFDMIDGSTNSGVSIKIVNKNGVAAMKQIVANHWLVTGDVELI